MTEAHEDEQDRDSFEEIRETYAERLRERVDNGETLTPEELSFLESVKADPAEIPERLHIKKPKAQRSPAQKAQSMRNIERINKERLQTGPNTPEGKAIASRNAIKYGIHAQRFINFIRPCLSTCPEHPCALVKEGATEPGGHCMEKHNFMASLDAIHDAIVSGSHSDFKGLMAFELTANLEVVRTLREHIMQSPLVMSIKRTSTKDSSSEHHEFKANPAGLVYTQLLRELGLNFKEAMITPRQVSLDKNAQDGNEAIAALVGKAGKKLKSAQKAEDKPE